MERIEQRTINIFGFLFIALANGADIFAKGADPVKIAVYCAPFLLFTLVQRAIKSKDAGAWFFLTLSVIVQLTSDRGNFSAAVFMMFAVSTLPRRRFYIPAGVIMALSTFVHFVINQHSIADYMNIMVLYLFIGVTYYKLHFPKRRRPAPSPLHDSIDLEIAQLMIEGNTYKEISDILDGELSENAIAARVKRMRKKYGDRVTNPQLVAILYNLGYIRLDVINVTAEHNSD